MNIEIKTYVIALLESYQKRKKQIELLHYELAHPSTVSEDELIGALLLSHGEGGGHTVGHISDKTLYIALNYQEQAETANRDTRTEIVGQLVELEKQQERLKYYVSLLDAKQSELIKLLYFEGCPQERCAKRLGITTHTVRRLKEDAIRELTELYCFTEGVTSQACPKVVQHFS